MKACGGMRKMKPLAVLRNYDLNFRVHQKRKKENRSCKKISLAPRRKLACLSSRRSDRRALRISYMMRCISCALTRHGKLSCHRSSFQRRSTGSDNLFLPRQCDALNRAPLEHVTTSPSSCIRGVLGRAHAVLESFSRLHSFLVL